MPEDLIRYEALVLDALRGVVRSVLQRVLKRGVPGDHHFFITFDTRAPGVGLSKRLKEQYPHEMTIVLQHQFWDLAVTEDRFEVRLSFNNIPERLVIPIWRRSHFPGPERALRPGSALRRRQQARGRGWAFGGHAASACAQKRVAAPAAPNQNQGQLERGRIAPPPNRRKPRLTR